jgi:RNA polymerase sigma factor (sigma-70 family)
MSASESNQQFLVRLNAGNESAREELCTRYMERLRQVASGLISQRLQSRYEAEDAAHSALGSFFRAMSEKRYHFDQPGRLWSLLKMILLHKIQDQGRRCQKVKEDRLPVEIADGKPSQEMAVELADAIEAALCGFKPRHLEICRLFLFCQDDFSVNEIADRVGCTRWTVRRVLTEFGSRLRDRLAASRQN